jgi:hypothetical protein
MCVPDQFRQRGLADRRFRQSGGNPPSSLRRLTICVIRARLRRCATTSLAGVQLIAEYSPLRIGGFG